MKLLKGLLIPIFAILIWKIGTDLEFFNTFLIPSPERVFKYIIESAIDGSIFVHIIASLRRVAAGFAIAAVIGIPLGIIYGGSKKVREYSASTLEFFRHIPPLAMISLLILTFGIGESSKIALIVMASFFPIFVSCSDGIAHVDKKLIEVGKSFKLSQVQIFARISVPCAAPSIITGLQLGMGYSFRALVGAEMIAAASGMGYLIKDAETFARTDVIFAGIIILGLIGMLIDWVFIAAIRRITPGEKV